MSAYRKFKKLYIRVATKALRLRDFFAHQEPLDELLHTVKTAHADAAFADKVVIITGSSAGIGLAIGTAFAQKGARVVLNGRRQTALDDAQRTLAAYGDKVIGVCADVAHPEGAEQLVAATLAAFQRVDILINNAGVAGPYHAKAWDVTPAEWQQVLDINLTGPFLCARAVMQWMVKNQRGGRIINVSSGVSQAPYPCLSPYATSKIALEGFTRNLALDADGTGIVVTAVQLGSTRSAMTREFFKWEEYQSLPPPESVVPVFWYAATAAAGRLHGRIIASWRFNAVGEIEAQLATPLAMVERFSFGQSTIPENVPASEHIILNKAENQFGAPESVQRFLGPAAAELAIARYPDQDYTVLRTALAERLKLAPAQFTFGNGSSELIERMLRVFVKPGEAVISNDPSWFMFDRFAYMLGIVNEKVPFADDARHRFNHNLEGVLAKIRGDTRLIYLVSPSNPLGVPLQHDEFAAFLARVPTHIPVVVDEAYVDFADAPDQLRSDELVGTTDRSLIALRTFSKFYGLAGLRVGYGFGSASAVALLSRLELLFNLSSVAANAAALALQDTAHAERTYHNNQAEKARIMEFLQTAELDFVPTQSNMLMFETPALADTFYKALEATGIVVPQGVFLGKYTLWPIGLPAHNDRIMHVIRGLL
ncbi:MAG: SDR family NAD(P)-dependent oxidoreductase [Gammaproteobacteria bacterium]